jgi:hypothetical protein
VPHTAESQDLATAHTPVAPRSAARPEGDGPPTLRVLLTPTPARIPRPLPLPAAAESPLPPDVTPPPVGDLGLSISSWGSDGEAPAAGARRAPRVGDSLLGFKLVAELGRGAFARVYLGEQASLANRPVALKVTLRPTREAERG